MTVPPVRAPNTNLHSPRALGLRMFPTAPNVPRHLVLFGVQFRLRVWVPITPHR